MLSTRGLAAELEPIQMRLHHNRRKKEDYLHLKIENICEITKVLFVFICVTFCLLLLAGKNTLVLNIRSRTNCDRLTGKTMREMNDNQNEPCFNFMHRRRY